MELMIWYFWYPLHVYVYLPLSLLSRSLSSCQAKCAAVQKLSEEARENLERKEKELEATRHELEKSRTQEAKLAAAMQSVEGERRSAAEEVGMG